MSTRFDGVANHHLHITWSDATKLVFNSNLGNAIGYIWKPLEVKASGIVNISGNVASNPYADNRIWCQLPGLTVNSGSEFYQATDGWRFDMFRTGQVGGVLHAYHDWYRWDVGVWHHTDLGTVGTWSGGAYSPTDANIGAYTNTEVLNGNIAVQAIWDSKAFTPTDVETLISGMWNWMDADYLLNCRDLLNGTDFDVQGLGIVIDTAPVGRVTYSTDEPAGWTYSTSAPGGGPTLYVRQGGLLRPSSLAGRVRLGGVSYGFGP